MKFPLRITALASCTVLGCGTFVEATALNPAPHPLMPRPADSVEVYSSVPPSRPHVDVALLKVDQDNGLSEANTPIMIQKLREAAGEKGCDAVFISGTSERAPLPDGAFPTFDFGSHLLTATCIVYVSEQSVLAITSVGAATPDAGGRARTPVVASVPPKQGPSAPTQVFR